MPYVSDGWIMPCMCVWRIFSLRFLHYILTRTRGLSWTGDSTGRAEARESPRDGDGSGSGAAPGSERSARSMFDGGGGASMSGSRLSPRIALTKSGDALAALSVKVEAGAPTAGGAASPGRVGGAAFEARRGGALLFFGGSFF